MWDSLVFYPHSAVQADGVGDSYVTGTRDDNFIKRLKKTRRYQPLWALGVLPVGIAGIAIFAIGVSIFAGARAHSIKYDTSHLGADLGQALHRFVQIAQRGDALSGHQNGGAHMLAHHDGISDRQHGLGIQKHQIVFRRYFQRQEYPVPIWLVTSV